MKRLGMVVLVAAAMLGFAETPGRHPRYLHARSDLRTAQWLLRVREEPNVTRHLRRADEQIEAAIREADRAAMLDRKEIDDHPRADTSLDRRGRFRKVMALLRSAREDIGREEDNPRARGWRDAAFRHIDAAMDSVRDAARDLRIDRELGFWGWGGEGYSNPRTTRCCPRGRATMNGPAESIQASGASTVSICWRTGLRSRTAMARAGVL